MRRPDTCEGTEYTVCVGTRLADVLTSVSGFKIHVSEVRD